MTSPDDEPGRPAPDEIPHSVPPGPFADEAPPADASDGPTVGPLAPERVRRRKRAYVLGTALGLFIAVFVACAFIQVPYYRFSPGTLYPTQPLISVSGAPTYDDPGQIDFTTVSSQKATVLQAGLARFDPAVELVDQDLIDGGRAPEETRQLNLEMMADSKQVAEVVALRKLGYPIEVLGTGAVVRAIGKGMPAESVLVKNDTIVAVDGQKITTADEAVKSLAAHQPGDTITLTVDPPPDVDSGHAAPTKQVTVTLTSRAEDASKPLLGVDLGTRNTQFKLPVSIDIDSKSVGGPSAGLAFTLGIMDKLTPGSLSGGKVVAVTGTMDLNGTVGPIGGIQQKTFLAQRSGAALFLVPNEELADAKKYASGGMRIVGVGNLDEALEALAENGGDTDAVQQAAAARTPGTTAH